MKASPDCSTTRSTKIPLSLLRSCLPARSNRVLFAPKKNERSARFALLGQNIGMCPCKPTSLLIVTENRSGKSAGSLATLSALETSLKRPSMLARAPFRASTFAVTILAASVPLCSISTSMAFWRVRFAFFCSLDRRLNSSFSFSLSLGSPQSADLTAASSEEAFARSCPRREKTSSSICSAGTLWTHA